MNKFEMRAQYKPYAGTFEIYGVAGTGNELMSYAKPLEFEMKGEGLWAEPFVQIDEGAAQQLIDDLWNAGLRPKNAGAGSDQHLQDMRAIAFAKLKVDMPQK